MIASKYSHQSFIMNKFVEVCNALNIQYYQIGELYIAKTDGNLKLTYTADVLCILLNNISMALQGDDINPNTVNKSIEFLSSI